MYRPWRCVHRTCVPKISDTENKLIQKGTKDAPIPRPNKKPRLERSEENDKPLVKTNKPKDSKPTEAESKKDAQVEEYMQVMQPRTKKARTWANDDPTLDAQTTFVDDTKKDGIVDPETVSDAKDTEDEGTVEEVDDLEWMKRRMQRGIQSKDLEEKLFAQDDDGVDDMVVDDSKVFSPSCFPANL